MGVSEGGGGGEREEGREGGRKGGREGGGREREKERERKCTCESAWM